MLEGYQPIHTSPNLEEQDIIFLMTRHPRSIWHRWLYQEFKLPPALPFKYNSKGRRHGTFKKETDIVKSEQAKGLILEKMMMITYRTRQHLVKPYILQITC
jgi:hypothetical protein